MWKVAIALIGLAASPAYGRCLDPDDSTPSGARQLGAGMPCLKNNDPPPAPKLKAPSPLPVGKQAAVKAFFDAQLFDGISARWKWPAQRGSTAVYCGWVNAKNRMGAYTGWSPFYVLFEGGRVTNGGIVDDGRKVMLDMFCVKQGYDITTVPVD
jgi:hypothetical protein